MNHGSANRAARLVFGRKKAPVQGLSNNNNFSTPIFMAPFAQPKSNAQLWFCPSSIMKACRRICKKSQPKFRQAGTLSLCKIGRDGIARKSSKSQAICHFCTCRPMRLSSILKSKFGNILKIQPWQIGCFKTTRILWTPAATPGIRSPKCQTLSNP